jgi:hypothetical protein
MTSAIRQILLDTATHHSHDFHQIVIGVNEASSPTGFQHELACLFDVPHFFTLDEPLVGSISSGTGPKAGGPNYLLRFEKKNAHDQYSSRWRQHITVVTWHRKGLKSALLSKQCGTKTI